MPLPIMPMVSTIATTLGIIVKSVMGFKSDQASVLSNAIRAVEAVSTSTAEEVNAISTIIQAEASSDNWLTSNWRPLVMVIFAGIIVSYWFGYSPPNIDAPMSPMMLEIFDLVKLGLGGYMGGRTIEKVVKTFNIAKIVQAYLAKKIL